ncbi:ABC transporter permease [Treponema sp. TIM-1]|uniref:ABC transporter permease n=1 Tax=Treponema sp. TIM-1 TaxID=2898417 RepID=UPI00397F1DE2
MIQPRFFSVQAIINILLFFPYLLLVALGEMIEIISRNVDLSLGSILCFAGYLLGLIFSVNPEFPLLLGMVIAIGIGALLGLLNGTIVTVFKIPSVIVTLGTMYLYRGVIFYANGGRLIENYKIPRTLIRLSQVNASVIGIPYSIIIALAVALLVAFFLRRLRLGRDIYAAGSNPKAAETRGISLKKINILVFVIAGALSGFASMIFMSRIGFMDPGSAGRGLEFTAIAAVVIGGCSMGGGVGTTLGTVIGCLMLGVINNAISITGISGYWQEAIYGFIIILSVIADNYLKKGLGGSKALRKENNPATAAGGESRA